MSQQLQITGGAKVRDLNDVIIGTSGVLSSLAFNVANGVPKLDSNAKILVSQLPNSVMEYLGTWNAATNTPFLVNGTGNAGDVYLCNVAGTVDFGAGPISFVVSDQVIYSGSIWQKASGSNGTVTSIGLSSTGNDAITITGSPVTTSGTINLGFAGTNLQYINGAGDLTTFPTLISSIGLSMPSAFSVANSPLTSNGTIAVTGAGYPSQYIRGDGTLADFPTSGGGGSSVSYYLNGGTSQGTIGGVTYYEMSKTADTGTMADFSLTGNGFIVAFLTDAGDPAQLNIPAGNWNYEIYASMSANGGTPEMYAELYKYDGTTFTLISTSPHEILYDGTALNLYTFAMTVPATTLALTDRLAVKLYATNSGEKTTTVHTQDSHLCQIITTFSTGITALNGLTAQVQYFATGTSGTDFNISSTTATHTFNIPDASATNRGLITTGIQTIAGSKTFSSAITADSGITLKEGVIPSAVGYTGLAGDVDGLVITKRVSSTAYTNLLYFNSATSNTYTFPNLSGTLALLEGSQTFSGLKTFSSSPISDGGYSFKILASGTPFQNGYSVISSLAGNVSITQAISAGNLKSFTFDFSSWPTNTFYTYTLPASNGTIALTSNLSTYVPYTGATTDLNLGLFNLFANALSTQSLEINTIGGGNAPINFYMSSVQKASISASLSTLTFSAKNTNGFQFQNPSNAIIFSISNTGVLGNGTYSYTLPSATGTLALTSDIPSLANYVTLNGTQTISGNKTFSGINSFTGYTSFSYASTFMNGASLNWTAGSHTAGSLTLSSSHIGSTSSLILSDGDTAKFIYFSFTNTATGTKTYTLPDASGTIALTSNLSAYLPLTGGTLTGNLTGTTATFGGDLTLTPSDSAISFSSGAGRFFTGGSERLRITSGGLLNILSDSTNTTFTSSGALAIKNAASEPFISWHSNTGTRLGFIQMQSAGTAYFSVQVAQALAFDTSGAERMRITGGGLFKFQNNGSSYESSTAGVNEFNTAANDTNVVFRNTASSLTASRAGVDVFYTAAAPNNGNAAFYQAGDYSGGRTTRFSVTSNGNVYNVTGTYTSGVSDIRYKEQIVDANSQWNDIKSLRVVNFKFIKDVKQNGDAALRQIGFIAQEVEKISPNLVEEMSDEVETWKTIKASIIHTKAIKALQEAMIRIESLEATITSLQDRLEKAGL